MIQRFNDSGISFSILHFPQIHLGGCDAMKIPTPEELPYSLKGTSIDRAKKVLKSRHR
jgi:hypothetical protein